MELLYLNLHETTDIVAERKVLLKDVADINGTQSSLKEYEEMKIFSVPDEEKKGDHYAVSAFEIIKEINKVNPNVMVINVGEKDVVINYLKEEQQKNKAIIFLKVIFVSLILFCGGAIAIMTFQTDAALPNVFDELYMIFLGNQDYKPYLLEIPYAIGLLVGITAFFNHLFKIKITKDPTPIEVEMRSYEAEVNKCIVKNSSLEKGKKNA